MNGDPKNMAYENWILIKEHGICETCIFIIIKLERERETHTHTHTQTQKEEKKERERLF
jgi:hypothetical protein